MHNSIYKIISKVTGHNIDDIDDDLFLEADLGLDSIKMITLMNELTSIIPTEALESFSQENPIQNMMALESVGEIIELFDNLNFSQNLNTEIQTSDTKVFHKRNSVYKIISKVTGHNIDDIDDDLFLEADLGLDSIKMITLMNELTSIIPTEALESFSQENPIQNMMALESVGEIIELFDVFNFSSKDCDNIETNNTINTSEKTTKGKTEIKFLNLLNSQYPFLTCYHTISTLSITTGVMLEGKLDIKKLKEAWKELIFRHPSLQVVFEIDDNDKNLSNYKQRIIDENEIILPDIKTEKIYHFSKTEQTQYIKNKHEKSLNRQFDLLKWPLHEISVVCLEDNTYYINLSIIHLITDGLGNQQLIRELLEIYSNKIDNNCHNLKNTISIDTYNDFVRNINSWSNIEENIFLNNYLKKQGKDKYLFNPYNREKQITKPFNQIITATKKFILDINTTNSLFEQTKFRNASLFVVLTGIYLKTIRDFDKSNENIIINLPTSGKIYPNVDASGLVGSFAQNMALSFKIDENSSLNELIDYVNNEIKTNLIGGLDRAQTQQTAKATEQNNMIVNGTIPEAMGNIIRASIKSNLYLSYIGDVKLKENYNTLKLLDYESYTCTNPATIDMLVEIFNGKILFTLNYDSSFFTEENVELHFSKYHSNIKNFISTNAELKSTDIVTSEKIINENLKSFVLENISSICNKNISDEHLNLDMYVDLSIDSLQYIRLITNLSKKYKTLDKHDLFSCRTINNLLAKLNDTTDKYTEKQIPFLKIVEQCKLTPKNIAIHFENKDITYAELDSITNKIANYLISIGVERNSFIGIMTKPGHNMILGILGILKAGAAYIPIDFSYPDKRIEFIINHSCVDIILSEHSLGEQLIQITKNCSNVKELIILDNLNKIINLSSFNVIDQNTWNEFSDSSPNYKSEEDDLMVILYTSGSTGNPKGVMLNHKGYMNRLKWHQKTFQLNPNERVAQKTSCCFDISVWELLWPIIYGGTICPIKKDVVKNPWALAEYLIKEDISIMHFVPSLFGEFINAIENDDYKFSSLRWLIFSGETLPMAYIQKWITKYGMKTKLANLYGPTEASIDVTYHIITKMPGTDGESQIPIGKPLDNVDILVLDENMNRLQKGQKGELWIGGIQLAKGYLKEPKKTEKTFVKNPFSDIKSYYIYKTGDLAVETDDNIFEYHGRIDNQVKIRGFRIELGEIETVLTNNKNINEAAAIVKSEESCQDQLIVFVSGNQINDNILKNFISQKLPYYMIPHKIHWMDKLPKNSNGKLDRKQMLNLLDNNQTQKLCIHPNTDLNPNEVSLLPLLPAQNWLINYFDSPYNWTGFTRFKFKSVLDYNTFNESVILLTKKHDVLRSILCQNNSQWFQKILPEGIYLNVEYFDGTNIDSNCINSSVKNLIDETIKGFNIYNWPLWKIFVIKLNETLYDISMVGHHLISDVMTNNLLFNEIWSIYTKLLSGEKISNNNYSSYKKFVNLIESKKISNLNSYIKYWKNDFSLNNSILTIPQDFNGANTESSAAKENFILDKDKTSLLLGQSKKLFHSNVYYILLAPLYKMLGERYNKTNVIVSHRVHGRNIDNEIFFNTAGNFAVNFPLLIELENIKSFGDLVNLIKDKFEKVPLNGVSYDLISEKLPNNMYPDIKLTPIRANYLGNRDLPKLDLFEFSQDSLDQRYSEGDQKRISNIEFFFSVINGQLEIEVEYSKNMYTANTIKSLLNNYISELNSLINYVEISNITTFNHNKSGLLKDKVVVITGGGRGIGKSIAIAMAKEGAQTVIISRTRDQLIKTANEIKNIGCTPYIIQNDVKSLFDIQRTIDDTILKYGKIDILVNNAGITKLGAINDIEPNEWKNIVDVNLFGTYNLCSAVIPHFIERKQGKIINIGSDSSFIGYPLMSAYAASKHAILGLTRSLSEELKLYNIQVNAICPALVNTDMAPRAFKGKAIPPEKISDTAIFLASSMSDYITGEAIKVYGKQDMYWFGSQQTTMFKSMLKMKKINT